MSSTPPKDEGPFRKKSIARLSSPEQLDKLMVVIGTKGWISLWCLILLITGFIIWTLIGSIPIQVEGKGIILSQRGLFSIQPSKGGVVTSVNVHTGEWITPQTLIATLADPELAASLKEAEDKAAKLTEAINKLKQDKRPENHAETEIKALNQELGNAAALVDQLKEKTKGLGIYSSLEGHVLELDVTPGDIISPGQIIAWITLPLQPGETYLCYTYLPINAGERVRKGMSAEIELTNIDSNAYGYLLGFVNHVTGFPVSDQEIVRRIRNPQLVQYLKQGQLTVIASVIKPIPDPSTVSGYKWSTRVGPPSPIVVGTICNVKINVAVQKPINYLLPFLNIEESPQEAEAKTPPSDKKISTLHSTIGPLTL